MRAASTTVPRYQISSVASPGTFLLYLMRFYSPLFSLCPFYVERTVEGRNLANRITVAIGAAPAFRCRARAALR